MQKKFAEEEKVRREELPLVLKQKVSYDIVRRLHDLGDNVSLAQQRGILCKLLFYVQMRLHPVCLSYLIVRCPLANGLF
jgi:hypothetical protein